MCGIDGMIMVQLGHGGRMRRFSEGEKKGGQVTPDGGGAALTLGQGDKKGKRDWDLTSRGNVTR